MVSIDEKIFSAWLTAYGKAWEERDSRAFAALFAPGALYYWTPHDEPNRGRRQIADAFRCATSRQAGIVFAYDILSVNAEQGMAHWHCEFDRTTTDRHIHLDGIMRIIFDEERKGKEFREWWHTDEPCSEISLEDHS